MNQTDERTQISRDHDILAVFFYIYAVIVKRLATGRGSSWEEFRRESGLYGFLKSHILGTEKLLLMTYLISTMTKDKKPLVLRSLGYDMVPQKSGFVPERLSALLEDRENNLIKDLAIINRTHTEEMSKVFLLPIAEVRAFLKSHFSECTKDSFDETCSAIDSGFADMVQRKLPDFCSLPLYQLIYWATSGLIFSSFRSVYSGIESRIEQTSDEKRLAVYSEEKKIIISWANQSIEAGETRLSY